MNHLSKAQKIVAKLLETPVRTDDPDVETEEPMVDPDIAPATPEPSQEPDEKPNPFRRREIRPGQEPRPKACESEARKVVDRLIEA
jgi:hypothetical protein